MLRDFPDGACGENRAQAARLFFRLVDTMQKQISEYKLDEKF